MGFVQISPAQLTTTGDATPVVPVGTLCHQNGNTYRYIYFDNGDGNVAAAAGLEVFMYDVTTWTVTTDYSYAGSKINLVCGILLSVLTDTYYGWMQIGGYHSAVLANGDGDIVAGDLLIAGAADTGVNRMTAGTAATNRVVGVAVADDTASTGAAVAANITLY